MANSYKFIRKYGILHLLDNKSTSHASSYDTNTFEDILFSDVIIDVGKNQFKK